MKRINLLLALGAVALLAFAGVAMAKDHGNDDNGHHGHHGRHHHHHFREMSEAGTIATFDATTGRLTIALTGGETVSGLVTEETRINCEGEDDRRFDRRAERRDHGGGDDNGGHGNEPGDDNGGEAEGVDDNGGHGNEPGDDNGGEAEGGEMGEGPSCTTAALVPGAFVGEAELRLGNGAATFTEVELGHDS